LKSKKSDDNVGEVKTKGTGKKKLIMKTTKFLNSDNRKKTWGTSKRRLQEGTSAEKRSRQKIDGS